MAEFDDKEIVDSFVKSLKFSDTDKSLKSDLNKIGETLEKNIKFSQNLLDNLVKLQGNRKTSKRILTELESEYLESVKSIRLMSREYFHTLFGRVSEAKDHKKEISKFLRKTWTNLVKGVKSLMAMNRNNHKRSDFSRPTLNRSLFKGYSHYQCAEKMISTILQGKEPSVPLSSDGKVQIEEVLDFLVEENPSLDYVGEDHLVELYLRHSPSLFYMEEDTLVSLRPKDYGKEVEPPEFLYFGTVRGVANRAVEQGLQSQKRDFTVMTESEEAAAKRATQFGKKLDDEPVVLEILSKEAFDEGTEFLVGGREGLYMASRVSKKYINPEIILAAPVSP